VSVYVFVCVCLSVYYCSVCVYVWVCAFFAYHFVLLVVSLNVACDGVGGGVGWGVRPSKGRQPAVHLCYVNKNIVAALMLAFFTLFIRFFLNNFLSVKCH